MPQALDKVAQVSVPIRQFPVGQQGPFTTGLLPSALTGYQIDLQNDATWPASGDVVTLIIEQSNDSGQTWAFDASITVAGGQWFADRQRTIPTNTFPWLVELDNQGSTTRKVRLTANFLQACRLGATLSSLT